MVGHVRLLSEYSSPPRRHQAESNEAIPVMQGLTEIARSNDDLIRLIISSAGGISPTAQALVPQNVGTSYNSSPLEEILKLLGQQGRSTHPPPPPLPATASAFTMYGLLFHDTDQQQPGLFHDQRLAMLLRRCQSQQPTSALFGNAVADGNQAIVQLILSLLQKQSPLSAHVPSLLSAPGDFPANLLARLPPTRPSPGVYETCWRPGIGSLEFRSTSFAPGRRSCYWRYGTS
jgi:hypothetical protein